MTEQHPALLAARAARADLADASASLPSDLASFVSKAVGALFAIEADPGRASKYICDAMADSSHVLAALQERDQPGVAFGDATRMIARSLARLYPIRAELDRASLHPQVPPEVLPSIPIARPGRRSSMPTSAPAAGGHDRRKAERAAIEVDIGFHSETNFYTGWSEDLSDGGLFVATYHLLRVGTELTVSFILPGGHPITTQARVRWIREPRNPDAEQPGMGVEFEQLDPQDRAMIMRFVAKRPPLFFTE